MKHKKNKKLIWSLVIATYKREDILPQCLKLAAEQTRPPKEIIVVDASPYWKKAKDKIMEELASKHKNIKWRYINTKKHCLPFQRNKGIRLATANILFLVDDDSLIYPDCAEEIMKVYEADIHRKIVGVNAVNVTLSPEEYFSKNQKERKYLNSIPVRKYNWFVKIIRKILDADNIFVPYDYGFPNHPIPKEIKKMNVGTRKTLVGWGMTIRRSITKKEPFEGAFYYSFLGEDSDMSYRASRHGSLVTAFKARLHHSSAPEGRSSTFITTIFWALNPLVLHKFHSNDIKVSKRLLKKLLYRRFLIYLLKDLSNKDFLFPRARGTLLGLKYLERIFSKSKSELRKWYPQFQKQLIEKYIRKNEKN